MPKHEVLASPPMIFSPPPRRTYDCLKDGDLDCVEPRRSSTPSHGPRVRRTTSKNKPAWTAPKAEGAAGTQPGPKLKKVERRGSTQKHSKQDLQTQASSEDFSATFWQEQDDLQDSEGEMAEIEVLGSEVDEWVLEEQVPLHEALLKDLQRQGSAAIRAFHTAMAKGTQPLHSVKLCLVGHARAGKTSTLRSLSGRHFDPNQQSTHGVETKSCTLDKELWSPSTEETAAWKELSNGLGSVAQLFEEKVAMTVADTMKAQAEPESFKSAEEISGSDPPSAEGAGSAPLPKDTVLLIERAISGHERREVEKVVLQTWDFAGQEMYYNMAHVFLTAHGIYVLVLDLSAWRDATPLEKVESVDFWLAALLVHASDAWLVIVGSHADAIDESMRKEVYRRVDDDLSKRVQHKHVWGNQQDGLLFFPVDNQQDTVDSLQSIQHLRQEVSRLALKVAKDLGTIPTRWAHFFHLLEGLVEPCIGLEECRRLAETLAIDHQELDLFLGLFHRLGQLLYFKGSPAVVLTPQWLMNAMAQVVACPRVLNCAPMDSKALKQQGQLRPELLEVLWEDSKFQGKQVVLQSFLEHFDLLIPSDEAMLGSHSWLVPSLLPHRPAKTRPLDSPVSVLLDFKGAFRRLLSTLIPRLLCQLRKRPVIATLEFSEWQRNLEVLMKGRQLQDYDLHDRRGHIVTLDDLCEVVFPVEVRHRQDLKIHQMFRDFAKFTVGQTLVTFELFPAQQPEVLRVEACTKNPIFLKDLLDSLHAAICAWLPEVSYATGVPCPCGMIDSGHLLELNQLLQEETIWCDQLECLVKQRPEEDELIQNWRQQERTSKSHQPLLGRQGSTPKQRTVYFMYASPLKWHQQRISQLNIPQELESVAKLPWTVSVATPLALVETLQMRPLILHITAHSGMLPPKFSRGTGESRRALLLEDAHGLGQDMDANELLDLGSWEDVGLLVLLSCNSKTMAETLNCPCAVCCNGEVRDLAARQFCRSFYLALSRGFCLAKAFFMGQQAVRCGSDAGLRSEAEKFVLLQRDGNSDDLSLLEDLDSSAVSVRWPPMPRVEDFQCQASQMVAMANCLEHRRVILLLGAEGAGKTATCREFAHHFGGPGRLFSGKVKFLEAQDFLDAALVGAMDKFLWKALGDLSATGEGLPLLVIDNLHIFQAAVKQELRMALEGALSSLTTLRLLLTSREGLGGDWAFLEHGKVVEVKMEDLSMEDAAQLFLRRCRRPLYPRDFEAESASLEGASVQRLLRESALLKALDRLPGCIIRAAAQVDDELSTLLNHPALGSASLKHPQ